MTLTAELNQKAKAILFRELGPVDYARRLFSEWDPLKHRWNNGEVRCSDIDESFRFERAGRQIGLEPGLGTR